MRDQDYPFLSVAFSREAIQERVLVINDIMNFITSITANQYHPLHGFNAESDAFRKSVDAVLSTFLSFINDLFKVPRSSVVEPPPVAAQLVRLIRESMRSNNVSEICGVPFSSPDLAETVKNELGAKDVSLEPPKVPSVERALEMAKSNLTRTETAIVLLSVLREILFSTVKLNGFDEVLTALFRRRQQFTLSTVLFGALAGGKDGHDAVKMIARKLLIEPKRDITHYLQPLGISPLTYEKSYENAFREDIIKRCDEL